MSITFVDRESELTFMDECWKKKNTFLPIYGRRRVGKTRLIKEFIRNKPAVEGTFLAQNAFFHHTDT